MNAWHNAAITHPKKKGRRGLISANLLGSNDQLTDRDDSKLEERASRLLVACVGSVLKGIDRRLKTIPLATAAPAASKARSIKVYMAENEQLKTKLEKRTREVRDLKRALAEDARGARPQEGPQGSC